MSGDSLDDDFVVEQIQDESMEDAIEEKKELALIETKDEKHGALLQTLLIETGNSSKSFSYDRPFDDSTLLDFIKFIYGDSWKKKLVQVNRASPRLLIITSNAYRVIQLAKLMKPLHVKVAKLFARHSKINDQQEFLQRERYPIAICTPNRGLKFLSFFKKLDYIIMDLSYRDKKEMCMLELKDILLDAKKLLFDLKDVPVIGF